MVQVHPLLQIFLSFEEKEKEKEKWDIGTKTRMDESGGLEFYVVYRVRKEGVRKERGK